MKLEEKTCDACRNAVRPLTASEYQPLLDQLQGWRVDLGAKLKKSYKFPDFSSTLHCANQIGELAEQEGHHPDLLIRWGELVIELWTHKVNGLTESDFVLAAKIDSLLSR